MERKGYSSRGRSSGSYSSSSSRAPSYGSSHSRYDQPPSRDYRESGYSSSRGGHHTTAGSSADRYHSSSASSSSRYAPEDRYRPAASSGYASSSSRSDDRYREPSYRSSSQYAEPVYESRSYDRHSSERSSSAAYKRPYPPVDEHRSSYVPRSDPRPYRFEERPPRVSPVRAAYDAPPPRSSFRVARRGARGTSSRGMRGSTRGLSTRVRPIVTRPLEPYPRPRRGLARGTIVRRSQMIRRQREEALAEAVKAVQEIAGESEVEVASKRRKASESEGSTTVKEEPKDDADKSADATGDGESSSKAGSGKIVKVTGTRGGAQPYIKLVCPHCSYRCLTFKDYTHHLSSSRHVSALHNISMRMKLYLQKLRERQRRDQAEIDKSEESVSEAESNFCLPCKLYYKNAKTSHEESKIHKVIVDYLNPRCKTCNINFHNRLVYEKHLASIVHIRKAALTDTPTDVKKEKKDDGDEEMSLSNFMTVDAVGNVDDESGEAGAKKPAPPKVAVAKIPGAVGELYVERVDVYFCRLCERYLARTSPLEKAIGLHCRGPTHKRNFRAKHGATEKSEDNPADAAEEESKTEETTSGEQSKTEEPKEKVVPAPAEKTESVAVANTTSTDGKKEDQLWDDVCKDLGDLGDIIDGDEQKSQGDEEAQERFNRLKNTAEKPTVTESIANGDEAK